MKKILVLLMLTVSVGIKAQVYVLEYTKYILHDLTINKKYQEIPVKRIVCFDTIFKNIHIMDNGKKIFDVAILGIAHRARGVTWYHCIDYKTHTEWDLYTCVDGYNCSKARIFQAKSKDTVFWLRQPLGCTKE